MIRTQGDIEAFHSAFFNVVARVFPKLEHLHYGIAGNVQEGSWSGTLGRLRRGSERLLECLVDVARLDTLPAGSRGLDLGCGLGGTTMFLANRCGLKMTGLNINAEQLYVAQRHIRERGLGKQAALLRGDACTLPLADGCFDVVVIIEVAFHVRDKAALFQEVARVLRPGGKLVMVDQESAEEMEVMGLFFFIQEGGYRHLGEQVGLSLSADVDLSREVATWMRDYVRIASLPFHVGAAALAMLQGGPGLTWQYLQGVRYFNGLILDHIDQQGKTVPRLWLKNAIKALRQHTVDELRRGNVRYKVLVMDREQ